MGAIFSCLSNICASIASCIQGAINAVAGCLSGMRYSLRGGHHTRIEHRYLSSCLLLEQVIANSRRVFRLFGRDHVLHRRDSERYSQLSDVRETE